MTDRTPPASQETLRELVRRRNEIRAELDAQLADCLSRGEHGYITCQLRRDRMEERLADVDAQLQRITKLRLL